MVLGSGMLRTTSSMAAWLVIAALAAATAPAAMPGRAVAQSGLAQAAPPQSAQHVAQDNAIRPQQPARKSPQAQGPVKVYLLRGFLNVFSLGMDDLAAKLQADGISATVMNHADFAASRIVTTFNAGDHGPIVLIGHSLGADAIVDLANALARYNIPIALLVLSMAPKRIRFRRTSPPRSITPNIS